MQSMTDVIAMVFDQPVVRGLAISARTHSWSVLQPVNGRDALAEALCRNPQVVIAQLSARDPSALNVISVLRRRRNIPLLAMATHHSDELETAVRVAGANSYLPDQATPEEITRTVRELLRRRLETAHSRDAPAVTAWPPWSARINHGPGRTSLDEHANP